VTFFLSLAVHAAADHHSAGFLLFQRVHHVGAAAQCYRDAGAERGEYNQ
jgi:hypothetical protein